MQVGEIVLFQYSNITVAIYVTGDLQKGSYTRTTSTHRCHHNSIDTLLDNPCVHRQQFTSLLFLKLASYTRADKSDLQVYPGFWKLTDLACYKTKSRNKLVNHYYQLVYSMACFM